MVDTNQKFQDPQLNLCKRQKLATEKKVITKKKTPTNKKFPLLLKKTNKSVLIPCKKQSILQRRRYRKKNNGVITIYKTKQKQLK